MQTRPFRHEDFGSVGFDQILPDPGGDIYYSTIAVLRGENALVIQLAGMRPGSSYAPNKYNGGEEARIHVLLGRGRFFCTNQAYNYGPGSSFRIRADELHAFVQVDTSTLFIKVVGRGVASLDISALTAAAVPPPQKTAPAAIH